MKLEGIARKMLAHYKYTCDLTKELDDIMGFSNRENTSYNHYISVDDLSLEDRVLDIRVPGCTVGGIKLEPHKNVITGVYLGVSSLITYPAEAIESIEKYIGELLEF